MVRQIFWGVLFLALVISPAAAWPMMVKNSAAETILEPAPDSDPDSAPKRKQGGEEGSFTMPEPVSGPVYVIFIEGEIELGLSAYVRRAFRSADAAGAGAVVIQINTPGGRVDATLQIKDVILDAGIPTIALVNRQAFSAGALVGLSAERLFMVPGSSIGAAAPVAGTGEPAGEKMVSAIGTAFSSAAETRGKDPEIARAMVDASIVIAGLTGEGKLLTLSHDEAIRTGIADGTVDSLDALLHALNPERNNIVLSEQALAERLVRFLTSPAVATLLMSLGFLAIFLELQTPGWGLGGSVALVCLGVYFWGHHLAGLAGFESVILIGIGIGLMVIEVFLLPGFGVFGLLGLASFITGLFLSRISQWMLPGEISSALYVISAALLIVTAGAWAMLTYLPRNRFFSGIVLFSSATDSGDKHHGTGVRSVWGSVEQPSFIGRTGVAINDLRPSGKIRLDGAPIDVVSEGGYLSAGTLVVVIEDNGIRRVVRPVESNEK
jgi:membrane-bound serine protease (ClpP class)